MKPFWYDIVYYRQQQQLNIGYEMTRVHSQSKMKVNNVCMDSSVLDAFCTASPRGPDSPHTVAWRTACLCAWRNWMNCWWFTEGGWSGTPPRPRTSQRCSIGARSWKCAGQCILTIPFWLMKCVTKRTRWGLALSSWSVASGPKHSKREWQVPTSLVSDVQSC